MEYNVYKSPATKTRKNLLLAFFALILFVGTGIYTGYKSWLLFNHLFFDTEFTWGRRSASAPIIFIFSIFIVTYFTRLVFIVKTTLRITPEGIYYQGYFSEKLLIWSEFNRAEISLEMPYKDHVDCMKRRQHAFLRLYTDSNIVRGIGIEKNAFYDKNLHKVIAHYVPLKVEDRRKN